MIQEILVILTKMDIYMLYHDGRMTVPGSVYKNGYYQAKDYSSEECNIIDGKRLTVAAPIEFSNSIWCFGPWPIMILLEISQHAVVEVRFL